MAVNVRRARSGDEGSIAEFFIKLVEQHVKYDPKRFSNFVTIDGAAAFYKSRFNADEARVLVAESERRNVGFAYLEFERRNYEELVDNAVWLHDIFVEADFRSKGVGRALMDSAAGAALEMGGNKLILATAARNDKGQEFFESLGFRPTMIEMTLDL